MKNIAYVIECKWNEWYILALRYLEDFKAVDFARNSSVGAQSMSFVAVGLLGLPIVQLQSRLKIII